MTTTTARTVQTDAQAMALRNLQQQSQRLLAEAATVTHRATAAAEKVRQGFHVNSLGELQSTAADFDRACALRQAAVEVCLLLECETDDINDASTGSTEVWFTPAR